MTLALQSRVVDSYNHTKNCTRNLAVDGRLYFCLDSPHIGLSVCIKHMNMENRDRNFRLVNALIINTLWL